MRRTQDLLRMFVVSVTLCTFVGFAQSQTSITKSYRGAIGDKHIEMKLEVAGSKVTGTYFYDQFKQEIKLEGSINPQGVLTLAEGTEKRPTGKFVCKPDPEAIELDVDCEWTRPNGTGTAMVSLYEQSVTLSSPLKIVPTLINNRKASVYVSYPQLTSTSLTPGMTGFNKLVETRVQAAIKEFGENDPKESDFDTNYVVLFASDSIVSVEMRESAYAGGAHPSSRLWTVNYNLKTNKELTLEDVFKPGDEYKQTIAEFSVKDINRRAEKLNQDEARRNKKQPEPRKDLFSSAEDLAEMDTWALTSKGVAVYFDFPHVIAIFTKTVVPYSELTRHLRPDGVIPAVK